LTKTLFVAAAAFFAVGGAALAQPAANTAAAMQAIPPAHDIIAAWDTDHDGGVSRAEWTAAGRNEQTFGYVDTNSDGKVDEAELTTALNAMRARQQQQAAPAAPAQGQ
jgi:hypothetical protein